MTERRIEPATRAHDRRLRARPCRRGQPDLVALHLSALALRSRAARAQPLRQRPADRSRAYELFRRALALRDQAAWQQVCACYRPQVERAVRRAVALLGGAAPPACLVSAAFARLASSVPPERFAAFGSLDALLEQLRRCAAIAVLESARAAARQAAIGAAGPAGPAWWAQVGARLESEAERAVLHGAFVLGLRPREIYERHRRLFASVAEVYAVKCALLRRLRDS